MMRVRNAAALMMLFLAGCGQTPQKAGTAAEGEVLPGSASDAMLLFDTVRSQAPLAPKPVSTAAPQADRRSGTSAAAPGRAAPPPIEPEPEAAVEGEAAAE